MPQLKSIPAFFWQFIKPYKWHYATMMLAPIVTSFHPFGYNYAMKLFLDAMSSQETITFMMFRLPIFIFIFNQVILEFIWLVSDVARWKSEPNVRRAIYLHAYDYLQYHSYSFFQDQLAGSLSSKLKGIWDGYNQFWSEMHHGLSQSVLRIIIGLIALSVVKVELVLCVLAWSILYVPLVYNMSLRLRTLSTAETESRHDLMGYATDNLSNIISLFTFASRKREYDALYDKMTDDFIPKQIKTEQFNFKIHAIGGTLYVALFIFILFYMVYLRANNQVTIGDFAFVFGMVLSVTGDIWHITLSFQDFSRAMGELRSSLSILELPHGQPDKEGATPLVITEPTIEFRNVCFAFKDKKPLFNQLNLFIKAGEKVGLVGISGAGKTSMVQLLLRYFSLDEGAILINGTNIQNVMQDSLRENIALIPQDTMLFNRTLYENIHYGRFNATKEEVIEAAKKAHIHEFIMTLPKQYEECVGERGIKVSGGQRQRIAIARAILKNVPILVLDEATSALDSQTEQMIQESLDLLMTDKQKTVIAIAHRLSTLKHMDRLIVLKEGKLHEEGTHDELIANPNSIYRNLWMQQTHI